MSQNIAHRFFENVDRLDGKLAIVAKQGNAWRSHTYAQLGDLAKRYQKALAHAGIKPGMRVMLMVKPGPDFMALTFALYAQGATAILIDPGMGVPNLLRCIEHVAPEAVIGIPKAMLLTRLKPGPFKTARIRLCLGFNAFSWFGWFGPSLNAQANALSSQPDLPVAEVSGEELAAIIFTTGSTGPPKGVEYPHRVFARQLDYIESFYGIDDSDTDQPGFPLFGLFAMALGGTSVIPDMDPTRPAQVDPVKFVETIKKHKVTFSFGSPAIWRVVAKYCAENQITLDTIKLILMAGAPVPGNLIKTLQSVLPDTAEIHTPYGATESLPAVDMEGKAIVEETWAQTCQGKGTCVGTPLPGIDVAIIKPTDGPIPTWDQTTELPTGEIGEITIKGDIVTPGYFNHAEHTAAHKIKDGDKLRHRIGDVGYKDEQGRLWFCGRKAHRVLTTNGPMYTIPCEGIINTLDEVYRSALVGVGKAGEHTPVIIVEPEANQSLSEAALLEKVKAKAAESELTRGIKHFLIHPSFPVDIRHNAKIFREKLAVWAAERI